MKEAFGGISLFQIVIIFILLFTGIMCLTINHSKAYAVKDELINIIQSTSLNSDPERLNSEVVAKAVEHLKNVGHRITGNCPNGYIGYNLNGEENNSRAAFCIKAYDVGSVNYNDAINVCKNDVCKVADENTLKMFYYDVILFYQLDIPGLNRLMNFQLKGTTKIIM